MVDFERRGRASWALVAILILAVALEMGWAYATVVRAQEARDQEARARAEAAQATEQARQQVDQAKQATAGADDLLGRVVYVEAGKQAAVLDNCRFKRLGDRVFLEGRVVDDKNEVLTMRKFAGGTTLFIPVSEITRLVPAATFDALLKSAVTK